ncbi:glycosyl transferase, family II [Desulfosarcina variabilis str. Montpellier]|uniref:glycosyltransferase family 2 protein n=1 Tax=Desulfosarcina variabilis TaxID=2300 RepID=UPI003AFB7CAE
MGRIGRGPLKGEKSGYKPADTTIVVLCCVPHFNNYYEERFEILKYNIASLLMHSGDNYDLLVIDNNSHAKVVDFLNRLKDKGHIDHLILNSKNIGLSGALNIAYFAAQGTYIAFSNDDIFFHPGWLDKHLEVIKTFPKIGLVSGQTAAGQDRQDEITKLTEHHDISCRNFKIPIDWIQQFTKSIGLTAEKWLENKRVNQNRDTYLMQRGNVKAFSGKTGYSYVFKKSILNEIPSFPFETGMCAGDSTDRKFALAIRDAGYYWLTTFEKTTEHMGNYLEPEWYEKFEKYHITEYLRNLEENIKS